MGVRQTLAIILMGALTLLSALTDSFAAPGTTLPGDEGQVTEPTQVAQSYRNWTGGKAKPSGSHDPTQGPYPQQSQRGGPVPVRYQVYLAPPAKQKATGGITLQPNETYQVLAAPGACGTTSVAQCQVDANGRVAAFFRDSCDDRGGSRGAWVASGCSRAGYGSSSIDCCR